MALVDQLLSEFDRPLHVDETAPVTAALLAARAHDEVIGTRVHALRREDAGFLELQDYDAAVRQYANQRGQPRPGHVAAEEEREPSPEDGRQQGREVVGDDDPERRGHRPEDEAQRGDARRCREVDLGRVPDRAREERIGRVGDRVRPPLERPHEEAGVAAPEAGAGMRRVGERLASDQHKRQDRVDSQRRQTLAALRAGTESVP